MSDIDVDQAKLELDRERLGLRPSMARRWNVTPHVAQNTTRPGGSAIDARTTRYEGYAASLEGLVSLEDGKTGQRGVKSDLKSANPA